MNRNCDNCGKEYKAYGPESKHCGHKCMGEARRLPPVKCAVCGTVFRQTGPVKERRKFCGLECANKGKTIANKKGREFVPCTICLRRVGIGHKKMAKWFPMVSGLWIYQVWREVGFDPKGIKSMVMEGKMLITAPAREAKQRQEAEERAQREAERAARPKPMTQMERYYANHEESKRRGCEYAKMRYHMIQKHEPIHKTRQAIRNAVRKIVKLCGQRRKQWRSEVYLGCSFDEARQYISRQFKRGMTWENHGTAWEIDHIMPLSKFDLTKPEHVRQATHYTNLQPLWKHENRMKSDKIINHQAVLL